MIAAVTLQRLAEGEGLGMGARVDEDGINGVSAQFAAVARSQALPQANRLSQIHRYGASLAKYLYIHHRVDSILLFYRLGTVRRQ